MTSSSTFGRGDACANAAGSSDRAAAAVALACRNWRRVAAIGRLSRQMGAGVQSVLPAGERAVVRRPESVQRLLEHRSCLFVVGRGADFCVGRRGGGLMAVGPDVRRRRLLRGRPSVVIAIGGPAYATAVRP